MRAIIIDDEYQSRETLKIFLAQYCKEVVLIGEEESIETGLKLIQANTFDLLFLDIDLRQGSGFDLLDRLENIPFQVVFVTAFDDFALKAFRYNAIDYLLKPIDSEELQTAVEKVRSNMENSLYHLRLDRLLKTVRDQDFERLTIHTSEGIMVLKTKEIIHIQSEGSYSTLFLLNGEKMVTTKSLREFEELLTDQNFNRIHQSHLINLAHVKGFLREEGGYALMENKAKVPVARRKKEEFLARIKEL